jgi:hypothetical protein
MLKRFALILPMLLVPTMAEAQIIQSVQKPAVPGATEAATADAAASVGASGTTLLPQGNLEAAADGSLKVGIEAADLFLGHAWRLYMRLTLPVSQKSPSAPAATATATATTPASLALSNTMIQQLTDPYGGVLNMSGGYFYRVGGPDNGQNSAFGSRMRNAITASKGQSAADATVATLVNPHGLFVDARVGLKANSLPNLSAEAPTISGTQLAVFGSAALGLKAILPAYDADPTTGTASDHYVGGLTLGLYVVANRALIPSESPAIGTTVKQNVVALTGMVGWNPKDTSKVALTFAFTPWMSDQGLAKQFVFGVTVQAPAK